jgi:hypothetical protein
MPKERSSNPGRVITPLRGGVGRRRGAASFNRAIQITTVRGQDRI